MLSRLLCKLCKYPLLYLMDTYPWIKMFKEYLQFKRHLHQIHKSHLANLLVHSAANSSCLALSAKYNRAMPGISGLSAAMTTKIRSVQESHIHSRVTLRQLTSQLSYQGVCIPQFDKWKGQLCVFYSVRTCFWVTYKHILRSFIMFKPLLKDK